MYRWRITLDMLQKEAQSLNLTVEHDTETIMAMLTGAVVARQSSKAVWSELMFQSLKLQIQSIVKYTKEELDEIRKKDNEAAKNLARVREAVNEYNTADEFARSYGRIMNLISRSKYQVGAEQAGLKIGEVEEFSKHLECGAQGSYTDFTCSEPFGGP
jgi:hypothetical protein